MRWAIMVVLAAILGTPAAWAQQEPGRANVVAGCGSASGYTAGTNKPVTQDTTGSGCIAAPGVAQKSGAITRPANTTAYSAGQAVCASTSVDCAPIALPIGRIVNGTGLIHGVTLIKSGTSTTNATFNVYLYQATPTLTGIHDASTYSPKLVDETSGAYRGVYAACYSPLANGDNVQYNCTISNPNGTGSFQADAAQNIYAVIQVTGAYTPASGETFRVNVSALQD